MFLKELRSNNKELFLQLSIHAALSNNIIEDTQKDVLNLYCEEIGINNYELEVKMDLDEILEKINTDTTYREKKIIILEIIALIMADSVYDLDEKKFMEDIIKKLNISDEVLDEAINLVNKFNLIFNDMIGFIN
ncbi:hypothetical protein ACEE21_01430 [Clostridium baratii]